MKADTHTLKQLFQHDIRYLIPTFQRPYVWNQEDQWEPLWEDVRNTAERYLDALQSKGDAHAAEKRAGSHFLGAVVLKQRQTPTASLEERDVIDGQQRMTTLQVLVDAAQESLEHLGHGKQATRLSRLVLNQDVDGDEVFKLWPTAVDRQAFRAAMTNQEDSSEHEASPIVQAHEFFKLQVTEWIEAPRDAAEAERRVHGLETALLGLIELVVIDLESADDAFVIFETLNARGTPLLASDLVKNLIMQTSSANGQDPDVLYETYWKTFEDDWWRKEVRQGRLRRPRIDTFLDYWLEMRTLQEVASHDVFPKFRVLLDGQGGEMHALLTHLKSVATTWRTLDTLQQPGPEETFVYRWRVIEAGPVTPLVLELFNGHQEGAIKTVDLRLSIQLVESFLVRRMLCRMTTKDYNRLFIELLRRVGESDLSRCGATIEEYLDSQTADSRLWPSNADVRHAVLDLPLYRLLTRGRLRLVLEALEGLFRTSHTEDQVVPRGLTIEHVMPRKWRDNWSVPLGSDPVKAIDDRERSLHTIGNLTLVSSSLNPSMSNSCWEVKKEALHKHSNLLMTRRLLDEAGDSWTDEKIRNRGETLARGVCQLWPRGSTP